MLEAAERGCVVDYRPQGQPHRGSRINGVGRTLRGDDDTWRKMCGSLPRDRKVTEQIQQ